jgi:transcriptional regulator GlxA family with amidase domain
MRIDIVTFDGHDELDVFGPYEVLAVARRCGGDLDVSRVTLKDAAMVTAAYGTAYRPDGRYRPGADVLVVPGGGWASRAAVGVWGEVQRGEWHPLLRDAAAAGTVMAGVCTGAMLLAHAGIIGSRRATTHHAARADLAATGATVVHDRVVDEGDLITGGGVTSGIDVALWIVARFFSEELGRIVADHIEYPWAGPDPAR